MHCQTDTEHAAALVAWTENMEVEPKRRRIRGKTTLHVTCGTEEPVVPAMKRKHRRPLCTVPRTRPAKTKAKANPHQQFGLMKDWRDAPAIQGLPEKIYAADFCYNMLSRLGSEYLEAMLVNWLAISENSVDEQVVVIKLGTICSGSEILFTLTPHLEAAIRACSQVAVKLEHAWACEADLGKAEWIAANFDVPYIFLDVGELTSEHGAQEYLTGTKCHPPPVDGLVAGTSCRDASKLNIHQTDMREAIKNGSGTTGSTFAGLVAFATLAKPKFLILENVSQLKDKPKCGGLSNCEAVHKALNSLGYMFTHATFDAEDVGLPARRNRLWMGAWRFDDEEGFTGEDEAYFTQKLRSILSAIVSNCDKDPYPDVNDFLLSPDSDAAVHWPHWTPLVQDSDDDPQEDDVQEAADAVKKADDNVETPDKKWVQQHENMWKGIQDGIHERLGCRSTLAHIRAIYDAGSLRKNSFFNSLTPRQRDLLIYAFLKYDITDAQGKYNKDGEYFIDVYHSMSWVTRGHGICTCVLPKSIVWLARRQRRLSGVESLLLQGADVRQWRALRAGCWTNTFLQNLAGNAFSTGQFAAFFVSFLAAAGPWPGSIDSDAASSAPHAHAGGRESQLFP